MSAELLLLVQLACTLFMTGLIWLVQMVHYPLFAAVGRNEFAAYASAHTSQISWVVVPVMLLELATAVASVAWPPAELGRAPLAVALLFLVAVWVVTAACSVPAHSALGRGFDPIAHHRLVATNWLRTAAWTTRAGVLLWSVAVLILG